MVELKMPESGRSCIKSPSELRGPCHISVMDLTSWPSEAPICTSLRRSAASTPAFACEGPDPSLSDNAFPRTLMLHANGESPPPHSHSAAPSPPSQTPRSTISAASSPCGILPTQAHRPACRNSLTSPSTPPHEHGLVTAAPSAGCKTQLSSASAATVGGGKRLPATCSWPPAAACRRSPRTPKTVRWLDHVAQQAAAELGARSVSVGSYSPPTAMPTAFCSSFKCPETRSSLQSDSPHLGAPGTPDSPFRTSPLRATGQLSATLAATLAISTTPQTTTSECVASKVANSISLQSQNFHHAGAGFVPNGQAVAVAVGCEGNPSIAFLDAEATAVDAVSSCFSEGESRRCRAPSALQDEEHRQTAVAPPLSTSPSEQPGPLSVQAILQAPLQQSPVPLEHILSPSMLYALEHAQPISAVHCIPRSKAMESTVVIIRARGEGNSARRFSFQEFSIAAAAVADHADQDSDDSRDIAEVEEEERRHDSSLFRVRENKRAGWEDVSAAWREEEKARACTGRTFAGSEGTGFPTPCRTGNNSPYSTTASGYSMSGSCSSGSSGASSTRSISVLSLRGAMKRTGAVDTNDISGGHHVHDHHDADQQFRDGGNGDRGGNGNPHSYYSVPAFSDGYNLASCRDSPNAGAGRGPKHFADDDVDQEDDVSDIVNIFCRQEGSGTAPSPPCASALSASSSRHAGSFSVREPHPCTTPVPGSSPMGPVCTWCPSSLPGDSSLEAICRRGSADRARVTRVSASSHSTGVGPASVMGSGSRQDQIVGAPVRLVASGPVSWKTRLLSCFVSHEEEDRVAVVESK